MFATSEGALGKLFQNRDAELESVIILELVSLHGTDPMRKNKPGNLLFGMYLGRFVNANYIRT